MKFRANLGRCKGRAWLFCLWLAAAGMAHAGMQFDLVCTNGTHLGHFTTGQNRISAQNGERPLLLLYCPSDQRILNVRRDDPSLQAPACAMPLEDIERVYMYESNRPPFPPCKGGQLAEPKALMFFD